MFATGRLRSFLILSFIAYGGCHLYIDEGSDHQDEIEDTTPFSWPDAGPFETDYVPSVSDAGPSSGCQFDLECGPGCFCNAGGLCEEGVPPILGCSDLDSDESACIANETCTPVYNGLNCTALDGSSCASASATCTCESFSFGSCTDS